MNATSVKFEVLNEDNYDTWKLQMRAILIKNDAWGYVSGKIVKPEIVQGNEASQQAANKWEEADLKAQPDIVLAISSSEIKQIKGCASAREIWTKLENIYQSKDPARKVALLNHFMSLKMQDGDDAQEHSRDFFDTIKSGSIQGTNIEGIDEDFECSVCLQGKMCRAPFPKASKRKTEVGDLIHSDVCGSMRVASHAKKRYFITGSFYFRSGRSVPTMSLFCFNFFIMNSTYNSKRHVFFLFAEKLDFFDQQLFES